VDERGLPDQIEKAVGQVLRSLGTGVRLLDRDHLLQMALRLNDVAAQEKDRGQYVLAKALCQRALDIFEKTVPPDHPQLADILQNYAGILRCIALAMSREAAHLEARAAAIAANCQPEERFFHSASPEPDARVRR
jgi:hypothetical protein